MRFATRSAIALFLAVAASTSAGCRRDDVTVYIGTYTRGWACDGAVCTSKGIYKAAFDPHTGELSTPVLVAEADNPSYLAVHPNGRFLYAVNEVDDFKGEKTGAVTAYAVDKRSGALQFLNQVSSHGADPCHISVTASGRQVLVANYSGGSVSSYTVGDDGRLADSSTVVHTGSGPHPNQDQAHAHFITEGLKPGRAYVADLGIDKVLVYKIDPVTGKLTANVPPSASVPPGSGPRHLAFHPNNRFLYSNNELGVTITTFAHDPRSGALTPLQTISTLPEGATGAADNAETQISQDGRFVYVSNRGDQNSIATFAVDGARGTLTPIDFVKTGGNGPRDFKLDPSGKFILVGHQNSDTIVVFRVDSTSGKIKPTSTVVPLSRPVNFAFVDLD